MTVDPDTQYHSLQLQWASHVNCVQRAGRVGRVGDGRVYRLVSADFYEKCLSETLQPEILRAPLNQLVLCSKLLELKESPHAVLSLAMNPPDLTKIEYTILFLKEIGALTLKCNGLNSVTDGDITFLGRVMAELPLDVHLSKFILLGHMFSCLSECIIMATGCSLNIFKTPFKERHKAYINRLQWADGSASDLIGFLTLFNVYQKNKRCHMSPERERLWCEENFVSLRTLREWLVLVKEIQDRLGRMNIRPLEGHSHVRLNNTQKSTVIKVVVCGAFYPHYFKRSSEAGQIDEREAVKVLGGRDPFSTVYLTGFDPKQPGHLYGKHIKDQLQACGTHIQVSFDSSSKVYVQFTNPNLTEKVKVEGQEYITGMPGKIRVDVYRAIRLRQLRLPIQIPILPVDKAWEMATNRGLTREPLIGMKPTPNVESLVHPPVLPGIDVQYVHLHICIRIDCGHFWAHNVDEQTVRTLCVLDDMLNNKMQLKLADLSKIKCGGLFAARYEVDKRFYRCKVMWKGVGGRTRKEVVQILFIDYGNIASMEVNQLYELPNHESMSAPAQAVEYYLSGIQPSCVLNPKALWCDEARIAFDHQTRNDRFYGKVYSVVHGVVQIELYKEKSTVNYTYENSLNYWLILKGYAQAAEESFLSKENHSKRLQYHEHPDTRAALLEEKETEEEIVDIEPPDFRDCAKSLNLKGPFSPLEMQIYSVIATGSNKHVQVETSSVNCVLLDIHPQDPHERLIVAAHVGQNTDGTSLSLRHTSLMPNIHGFPMLMSLLFCPKMEAKPTQDGSRFGAILCGLGSYQDSHKSIYPPHDICLTLDTDLTNDDLNQINSLRFWLNMTVKALESNYQGISSEETVERCQIELRDELFNLLSMKRNSMERVFIKNANVWGKCLYYSELLTPGNYDSETDIWPLHTTMQLNRDAKQEADIRSHVIELQEVALRMKHVNEITCRFCNVTVYNSGEMRVHTSTSSHKEAVCKAKANKRIPTFSSQ